MNLSSISDLEEQPVHESSFISVLFWLEPHPRRYTCWLRRIQPDYCLITTLKIISIIQNGIYSKILFFVQKFWSITTSIRILRYCDEMLKRNPQRIARILGNRSRKGTKEEEVIAERILLASPHHRDEKQQKNKVQRPTWQELWNCKPTCTQRQPDIS